MPAGSVIADSIRPESRLEGRSGSQLEGNAFTLNRIELHGRQCHRRSALSVDDDPLRVPGGPSGVCRQRPC
jgi:hypothetical protein